jgi:hypothetical protein
MYSEFQSYMIPGVISPEDQLTFVLFGENVFTVDSIASRVTSFEGVKNAEVYILTKWQYYDDWIIKEVDKRLSPRTQHKPTYVVDTLYATGHRT